MAAASISWMSLRSGGSGCGGAFLSSCVEIALGPHARSGNFLRVLAKCPMVMGGIVCAIASVFKGFLGMGWLSSVGCQCACQSCNLWRIRSGGLHCALHSTVPCGEQRLISRLLDIVRLMCRQRDLVQFSRCPFQGSIYDCKLTLNARPLART